MEHDEIAPGQVLKTFDRDESKAIERAWLEVFCRNGLGLNTKAYKWHIFSGGGYPALQGRAALQAYASHLAARYILLPNDGEPAMLTDLRPDNLTGQDVYVFPENMAWTMAFTHEDGLLGPYFAQHPHYAALQKDNEKRLKRQQDIAFAREQGWL
ncbi:DUF4275 family protein [Pseudomonas abyssi]|uniref:DUF4275 family protein n=1 Tax=Pseudomonas abyssi TaxID=170540 RepID=A0A395R509_9PSED|nr:DUF4275 family protein [Halopseudomonas gallaeciensis]RGP55187.1 hypothetical protein ASB58_08930 [Halopseudomonas gallaeciensis]